MYSVEEHSHETYKEDNYEWILDELQPVILAGGDDSHRGFDRALARFGDSTLIESVYTILNFTFTKEPMIVTDDHKNLMVSNR